ncbi:prepilin peptidase [Vibrio navarrensis]|uniref:Primosomal replication protein n=1 Tax=Vibrio navarrensis TaxID=29495 RepID=A0AAJ4LVH4_9VIBR|nr:primosomal replication protein [Vibrio navarrensis]MBE3652893.1 prepilin peptidase [Vibrio navarrensis]MBE3657483.1 prepilin peptidase [Vibrio navarrensis]QPL54504.1 primosomal replication protein [Vibrio navarrensis]
MTLKEVAGKLEQMAVQAIELDRLRGEHHAPLFDERLFSCRAHLLTPCVEEAEATLETLIREQNEQMLTSKRAQFLSERLLAQLAAISRELLADTVTRKDEIAPMSYSRKPINLLYQELAQHQEWRRRLRELVTEKQRALAMASAPGRAQAQQALLVAEQRLSRCQAAILKIENQITDQEKDNE